MPSSCLHANLAPGIKPDTFLTITDEDDDEPFVNVVLSVQRAKEEEPEKPVKALSGQKFEIPKKPKQDSPAAPTAVSKPNGKHEVDGDSSQKLKRPRDDEAEPREAKKAKHGVSDDTEEGVLVVEDDDATGAILIDDD